MARDGNVAGGGLVQGGKDKKKIHVNAAALVDLKAALFSKQREATKGKQYDSNILSSRKVSDKTSSIWRNASGPGKKGKRANAVPSTAAVRQEKERELSQQEEQELEKSRRALEAKAALYDKLSRGEGLKELNRMEDDGEMTGEEGPVYMVDFTKKVYNAHFDEDGKQRLGSIDQEGGVRDEASAQDREESIGGQGSAAEEKGDMEEEEEEGWVEYVDSLGRSRRCLKEDLPDMMRRDREMAATAPPRQSRRSPTPDLMSDDMRMDRERRDWEEQAEQELDKPVEPLHYQSVQAGEVRSHGVGYYAFSEDTEKRKEEMAMLTKLREQTFSQREKRQQLQEKRKALMDARLAKVRQRKQQKMKEAGSDPANEEETAVNLTDFDFDSTDKDKKDPSPTSAMLAEELTSAKEKARLEQEIVEEGKRASHVRPWDKGKMMDPIRKRKKELESERLNEFAPPSHYSKASRGVADRSTKKPRVGNGGDPIDTPTLGGGVGMSEEENSVPRGSVANSYPPPPGFQYSFLHPPPPGPPPGLPPGVPPARTPPSGVPQGPPPEVQPPGVPPAPSQGPPPGVPHPQLPGMPPFPPPPGMPLPPPGMPLPPPGMPLPPPGMPLPPWVAQPFYSGSYAPAAYPGFYGYLPPQAPPTSQAPPTATPLSSQAPPTATPLSSQAPPTATPLSSQAPPTATPLSSQAPPTATPLSSQAPPTATPLSSQAPLTATPLSSQGSSVQ